MSLFNELKRRNVFRVGLAYMVVGWLVAQVADLALESFGAPDWVMKTLLFLILIGFLIALFIAWAYELTPEGIKRAEDVFAIQDEIAAAIAAELQTLLSGEIDTSSTPIDMRAYELYLKSRGLVA